MIISRNECLLAAHQGLVAELSPAWVAAYLVPAVTPVPETTQATAVVLLLIFSKINGGLLPTGGTFPSKDHRR
jgi:Mg/Co/Ni transporter MgtE